MIDLIIPSYNDLNGLYATLFSLGYYADVANIPVTIVDDCSTNITQEDYNILINTFIQSFPIQILHLPENKGPGYARQYGIDHTVEPWLLFMDSGNLFKDQLSLFRYIQNIETKGEQLNMLTHPFLYEIEPRKFSTKDNHSEFHGTLIRRSFLEQYNLKVPSAYSYLHEDTPFIAACHIIAGYTTSFYNDTEVNTIRTFNCNSLTNRDNRNFYYQYSVTGFISNALEIMKQLNVSVELEQTLVYYYMTSAYNILLDLIEFDRPQYIEESKEAIKQFYIYYQKYFTTDVNEDLLRFHIYEAMDSQIHNQHFVNHYIVFDFNKFIKELEPTIQPKILT